MLNEYSRNPLAYALDEAAEVEKSPKVEGAIQGAKAAVIAAPLGAAIQALRGKNPYVGALIAGLGVGATAGAAAAAVQKYKNMRQEADLRYHLRNMVDREPGVALPDNNFVSGFNNVRYTF